MGAPLTHSATLCTTRTPCRMLFPLPRPAGRQLWPQPDVGGGHQGHHRTRLGGGGHGGRPGHLLAHVKGGARGGRACAAGFGLRGGWAGFGWRTAT